MKMTRAAILASILLAGAASHAIRIGLRQVEPKPEPISSASTTTSLRANDNTRPPRDGGFREAEPMALDTWDQRIQTLTNSPEGSLLDQTLLILSRDSGVAQLETLIELHQQESDPVIRKRISQVVSMISQPEALNKMRSRLDCTDQVTDPEMTCAMAIGLARRGNSADVTSILKRLDSSTDSQTVEGLTTALALVSSRALETLLCDTASGQATYKSPSVRSAAANALANFPTVAVTEVLHQLATEDPDESVRNQAARSLLVIRSPE